MIAVAEPFLYSVAVTEELNPVIELDVTVKPCTFPPVVTVVSHDPGLVVVASVEQELDSELYLAVGDEPKLALPVAVPV